MMTCKDCIHCDVCPMGIMCEEATGVCDVFKDKSRFIELPCKVGDVVYDIFDGTPYATKVLHFVVFGDRVSCRTASSFPNIEEFGKRIFLNRDEAEKALE